jgi:hypothetical protein
MKSGCYTVNVDYFPFVVKEFVSKGSFPTYVLFLSLTE